MDDDTLRGQQLADAVAIVREQLELLDQAHAMMLAQGTIVATVAAKSRGRWRNVLRCLIEAQHGHATPHYVAACEAYGLLEKPEGSGHA